MQTGKYLNEFTIQNMDDMILKGVERNIVCIGHDGVDQHFIDVLEAVWVQNSPLVEMLSANSKTCRECKKFEAIEFNQGFYSSNCVKWRDLSDWDNEIDGYPPEKNCSLAIDKPDYIQQIIMDPDLKETGMPEIFYPELVDRRISVYSRDTVRINEVNQYMSLAEMYTKHGGTLPNGKEHILFCVGRLGEVLLGCY